MINKNYKTYLKYKGHISPADNFYEYLEGEMPLPDQYVIGKDCKKNHGIDGKTLRRRKKDGGLGICIACERANQAVRRENKHTKDEATNIYNKNHHDAMKLQEQLREESVDDLFLT